MTRIPKSVKSSAQILKGTNHILQSLLTQSRDLSEIEAVIRRHVDETFAVASLKNNELTLVTSSGGLATRIRYRQRNLITSLRRSGIQVTAIKIKVQPTLKTRETPAVERHLSPENANQLKISAQYIEHEPLKKALIRLSKRSSS